MIVIDDFIPKSLQETYKNWLLAGEFPWYFTKDVTFEDGRSNRPCVSHKLYDQGNKTSNLDVNYLAHLGAEKYGYAFNAILNGKVLLQFPLNLNENNIDPLHTDINPHIPHLVVLYYVIDADGDTIICDLKNDGSQMDTLQTSNYSVLKRITPKQGRAVLFDGSYYHTAEQPKNGMRCIINLNVI